MRWLKFNFVGALGIIVQLGTLGFLVHVAGLHYLAATALAVEAAVLHNFAWHLRWTWADRAGIAAFASRGVSGLGVLLLRFNLSTGLVSITGNVALMSVFAGVLDLDPLPANLASICVCSLVNFLVCDQFVFLARPSPVGGNGHGDAPRA